MKYIKLISLCIPLLCGSLGVKAQTFQRWDVGYADFDIYNPAASFDRDDIVCLYGRYTFYPDYTTESSTGQGSDRKTNIGTEPFDAAAKANLRIKAGQLLIRASYNGHSFFRQLGLGGGYAYKWDVNGHIFTASALANVFAENVDFDKMVFSDGHTGKQLSLIPELDLGFQYRHGNLCAGCSAVNLIGSSMKVDGAVLLRHPRCFFINFAYDFHVQTADLQISPFAILGFCQGGTSDIGVYLKWTDNLDFSYSFRLLDTAHIFNLGTVLAGHYGIRLGYTVRNLHKHSAVFAMLEYRF